MSQSVSFPEAAEAVKQRLDVLETIGRFVSLKKKGRSHLGLCPFHHERSPSFNVSVEKGFFKCFGCGESGDAISFLMKIEHKSYGEIIREQADALGYTIRYSDQVDAQAHYVQKTEERERLWDVLYNASQWFHTQLQLPEQQAVQSYLEDRALPKDAIERFQLGYAPDSWDALGLYLRSACPHVDADASILERASVAGKRDNGQGYYDKFRHRLMVPIQDIKGRVVGFGGRALGVDQQPKYLNSSESLIYQKSQLLYGLFQAKNAIRQRKRAVVMEGYFDVISSHLAGLEEAVATCGTALTEAHIPLLMKAGAEMIYLCFDSDQAGRNAIFSALERLDPWIQRQSIKVRILCIPSGKDPDDYFKSHSLTDFETLMREAPDALRFRLDCVLEGIQIHHADGQLDASNRLIPLLAKVKHPIIRSQLLAQYAERLQLPEETLRQSLALFEGRQSSHYNASKNNYVSRPPRPSSSKKRSSYGKPISAPENFSRLRQALLQQQSPLLIEQHLLSMALSQADVFTGLQKILATFQWQSPMMAWVWQQIQNLDFECAQEHVLNLWQDSERQNKIALAQGLQQILMGQESIKGQVQEGQLGPIELLQMVNQSLGQWHRRQQQKTLERRNKLFRRKEHGTEDQNVQALDEEAVLLHYDVLEAQSALKWPES